jgi:hypothetical protein
MSGTSLYLLDLVKHEHDPLVVKAAEQFFYPRKSVYTYSYPPLPDSGTYFIEVMVLFCTMFNTERYMEVCMENPQQGRNIANLPYFFTHTADAAITSDPVASHRARWVLGNKQDPDYKNALLPTRYQNRNCGGGAYCDANWQELAQHRLYDWTDKPNWAPYLLSVLSNPANIVPPPTDPPTQPVINVCYVGASHAREFVYHSYNFKAANGTVIFIWIESKFPNTFSVDAIHERDCTYAILGYGQWPVSYYEPVSYSGERYRAEMRNMMLKISAPAYTGPVKFFMVSTNYNAMGGLITSCPPADHRNPAVIDMLNTIVGELSVELKIGYVDLKPVIGPQWDSALDYCHPKGKVFVAEAEYVLYHILAATAASKAPLTLHPGPPVIPDKQIIRFTDSNTLFYSDKGELRPIPNWHTFVAMGFDLDQVKVMVEWKKNAFHFGESMPAL